ncbi:MAG: chemotaxis protein CheX [Candidatus Melainabacteria bacterium]|nr:chemotaxis protein CheX [Candidatus Melainabacteria bacterium]
MTPITNSKAQIDASLVNAVVSATTNVLRTMASTEAVLKEVKAEKDYRPYGDISAVIGISGDNGEGMFALSFPLELVNLIASRLLGVSPDKISSEDRCDAVGELVNMISGSTKSDLSQQNNTIYKLSLPTVIQGRDHEISSRPKNNPYLVVIFESEGKTFGLQVSFKTY